MAARASAAGGARARAGGARGAAGAARGARAAAAAGPRANEAWGRESLEEAWAKLRGEQYSGKEAQIEGIRSNQEAAARGDTRTASRARKQANAWTKEDSLDAWAKLREETYANKGAKIEGIRTNEEAAARGRLGPGSARPRPAARARRSTARPAGPRAPGRSPGSSAPSRRSSPPTTEPPAGGGAAQRRAAGAGGGAGPRPSPPRGAGPPPPPETPGLLILPFLLQP